MWDQRKRAGEAGKDGRAFDTSIVLTLGMSGRNLNVVVFIRLIESSLAECMELNYDKVLHRYERRRSSDRAVLFNYSLDN
jgi:hypothetical protein